MTLQRIWRSPHWPCSRAKRLEVIYKGVGSAGKISFSEPSMDSAKMTELDEKIEAPAQLEYTHDDVFGEITEDGPNFRNVRTT